MPSADDLVMGGSSVMVAAYFGKMMLDILKTYRSENRQDKEASFVHQEKEDENERQDLRYMIENQSKQINALTVEIKEVRKEHVDCEKKHAALSVRLELLERKM